MTGIGGRDVSVSMGPGTPALRDPDAVATPGSGVQVNHRELKFICFGCGQEYPGLRDFLDCVEERLGEES